MKIIWAERFNADMRYYIRKKKYFKITADVDTAINEPGDFL